MCDHARVTRVCRSELKWLFSLPAQRRVGFATRAARMPAFTDLRARTNAGEDVSFDVFTGKVVLVVNVARL